MKYIVASSAFKSSEYSIDDESRASAFFLNVSLISNLSELSLA